jgi:hypothetical protein
MDCVIAVSLDLDELTDREARRLLQLQNAGVVEELVEAERSIVFEQGLIYALLNEGSMPFRVERDSLI